MKGRKTMKNKFRRVLSIAIAIIMVVSMMPMAFAADETNVAAIGEIEYASIKAAVAAANDGDTITVEPWRSAAFPVIRDLMVDRTAFDKIQQAGGYVSINTGGMPDANAIPIGKDIAEEAMDAAACIGCGACVAACKNGSAMLFVSAKVSQFALLPQGKVEAAKRVKAMVAKMDELGFGNCTNTRACEAECPKCVSISNIARLNREFIKAKLKD